MEALLEWFKELLSGVVANEIIVFIVSMVPILELRGGLLMASWLGVDLWRAIFLCVLGNVLPVPFILWLITPLFNRLKKTKLFRPLVEKLEKRAIGKSEQVTRYQFWGLALFVGIPLPGTGAWTGALIASVLNMPFKKAFPSILMGIALATVIMAIVSYGLLGMLF